MGVPVDSRTLIRRQATETQTRKSRIKRWDNVKEIFSVTDGETFSGKHILLVDDVITTGATLDSCISVLSAIPGCRVSIAALAAALV
jgi:predicted amidophosphoribosyltransferase